MAPPRTGKLKGAGLIGQRAIAIAGVCDPMGIQALETMIGWARQKVEERHGPPGEDRYQLFVHLFGGNGVMGEWEPRRSAVPHEVGILIETVAPTLDQAVDVAALAQRNTFFARFPGARGTAGVAALPFDEILPARPGYTWTINHVLPLTDPLELFPIRYLEVGADVRAGGSQ